MILYFTFQDLFDAFKPVLLFLQDAWEFLNTGIYTAYTNAVTNIPFFGSIFKPITDFIANTTNFDDFLNQYTVLTVSLAGGLVLVIVLTIIGFFTDKIGL